MRLPFGDGSIDVELPACSATVAEPRGGEPIDVRTAAEAAIADSDGPALSELATASDTVAIVVTDVTRATPDGELVDLLLSALGSEGITRDQVTVVVGLGLHRPMTDAELESMLGEHAALAVNHDPAETIAAGEVDGVEIECNRRVAAADLVLATGMVEPHQYAGFSGGGKTVAIGAGGESLIRYTHGPDMLSQSGVRLGRIDDNPFRQVVDTAGELCGLEFCINATHGPAGILDVAAGEPRNVVRTLVDSARDALSVEVDGEYDAVIAGVGAPKDANLYQTTRAATYVALGAKNPLREGGRIVIPAELSEGAGEGTGEQRFHTWLSEAESAESLYNRMRTGYAPGAQRAFVVARTLREHDVYITNSEAPDVVDDCLMYARERVEDAVDPGSDVLVVPDALNTLLV
ncbi:MAG: lactate racemase domain-containing protein [Halobacteriota archaeon]|uniref:lactate racemase domain-containing protein n=1 Tax=Natronomonas sp. TaxID=2184060 RepID=UPI00397509AD